MTDCESTENHGTLPTMTSQERARSIGAGRGRIPSLASFRQTVKVLFKRSPDVAKLQAFVQSRAGADLRISLVPNEVPQREPTRIIRSRAFSKTRTVLACFEFLAESVLFVDAQESINSTDTNSATANYPDGTNRRRKQPPHETGVD